MRLHHSDGWEHTKFIAPVFVNADYTFLTFAQGRGSLAGSILAGIGHFSGEHSIIGIQLGYGLFGTIGVFWSFKFRNKIESSCNSAPITHSPNESS